LFSNNEAVIDEKKKFLSVYIMIGAEGEEEDVQDEGIRMRKLRNVLKKAMDSVLYKIRYFFFYVNSSK
jgi:hypothetical protein